MGIDSTIVGQVGRQLGAGSVEVFVERLIGPGTAPAAVLTTANQAPIGMQELPRIEEMYGVDDLRNGDIVAIHSDGVVNTVFREGSANNSLFVTEQCNSHCIMCSQPPRRVSDIEYLLSVNTRAVRLMPKSLATLGITGGEPTLLGSHLAGLLRLIRVELPSTNIEILSNGRRFSDDSFTAEVAEASAELLLFSVPLYSDYAPRHDYVVQSQGAFAETIRGLYSLAMHGIRRELRVVVHQATYRRLHSLAKFVQRNLPFVEHVAFMGLEVTGFARANEAKVWVEPQEYAKPLSDAIDHLTAFGIPVSIYNVPLCLLPAELWPYARISISDWKREFLESCSKCSVRESCGGVFGTSSRQSSFIQPIL